MNDFLTVREAADRLNRRREWIYYLIREKDPRLDFVELKDVRPGMEKYQITAASVAAFRHRPRGNPGSGGHTATNGRRAPAKRASSK